MLLHVVKYIPLPSISLILNSKTICAFKEKNRNIVYKMHNSWYKKTLLINVVDFEKSMPTDGKAGQK